MTAFVLPAEAPLGDARYAWEGETIEVFVPVGHALVAKATATDFTVSPIPVEEVMAIQNHNGDPSGCLAVADSGFYGWVGSGIRDTSSGGGYVFHGALLSEVTIVVIGSGTVSADALGPGFNYWFTTCSGPANVGGSGQGSCSGGPFPGGFSSWDALARSNAVVGGAIYA